MNLNKIIAVLLIRLILGFTVLMQGFGKVFKMGVENIYKNMFSKFDGILPDFINYFTAYYTSYVELIGGLLLVLGFRTNYTLYILGSVLVIVTFGHGLAETIWDMSHVMYRAMLLIALLLLPREWDKYSVDYQINKSKK
ncbi:DoxX family membrane protein [Weeksellaceae bacterium TAE3-ERU29]|nr:DoxX family membrane protein [Weeksellaceae bacterium TAE3-ERU29]